MFRSALALGMLIAGVSIFSGCGDAVDPEVLAQRTKYMLQSEPGGALGVMEVRQQLGGDQDSSSEESPDGDQQKPVAPGPAEPGREFAVVGRIGGVPNPWSEGNAGFWIVDNTANASADKDHDHAGHSHAHEDPGHDPDTCPFCKQSNKDPKARAIVQFEDSQGKVLEIDARKLFDVSRNQTVVVQGRANFNDLGNLVISASGLYIRE